MPSLRWLKRHGALETPQGIRLIVGLGNPGMRYAHNRHNVGYMIVEQFADSNSLDFKRKKFNAQIAEGSIHDARVLIAKPQTFMNASGEAVSKLYQYYKVASHDLIVIYDDLDLPLGKIRLRADGSSGGHHGVESIIARLGSSDFPRLRIGIGRPDPDADVDHVLGNFDEQEREIMDETVRRAAEAIDMWLQKGVVVTMNKFN